MLSDKLFHTWNKQRVCSYVPKKFKILGQLIHAQHKPKHKLEKWFIISGDGVRPYKTKQTDQRVKSLLML